MLTQIWMPQGPPASLPSLSALYYTNSRRLTRRGRLVIDSPDGLRLKSNIRPVAAIIVVEGRICAGEIYGEKGFEFL